MLPRGARLIAPRSQGARCICADGCRGARLLVHGAGAAACSAAVLPAYHVSASKPRTRSTAQRVARATVSNPGPTCAAISCRSRPISRSAYAARAVRQAPLRSSSRVSPASTDRAASASPDAASTTLDPIPTLRVVSLSHSVRIASIAACREWVLRLAVSGYSALQLAQAVCQQGAFSKIRCSFGTELQQIPQP